MRRITLSEEQIIVYLKNQVDILEKDAKSEMRWLPLEPESECPSLDLSLEAGGTYSLALFKCRKYYSTPLSLNNEHVQSRNVKPPPPDSFCFQIKQKRYSTLISVRRVGTKVFGLCKPRAAASPCFQSLL